MADEQPSQINKEDYEDESVFSISLNPGGDEGSSFRTKNNPSAPYQRETVTERRGALDIRCTCLDVIHGFMSPESDEPATLIVFKFNFDSRRTARRIIRAEIVLRFDPAKPGDPDPEVCQIAPFDSMIMVETTQTEDKSTTADVKLGVPAIAGLELGGGVGWTSSTNRQTTDATKVIGSIDTRGRTFGAANSASWTLLENSTTKTGVPSTMCTAILLRREDDNEFRCTLDLKVEADLRSSIKMGIQKLFGRTSEDDPLLLDPLRSPTNKLQIYDVERLGSLDLHKLSSVTFQTVHTSAIKFS